jgi:hypothetical protein
MNEIANFKDSLLFQIQKEFWNERGRGARYRMTLVGVPFVKEQMGEKIKDVKSVKEWLVENKFAEDIQIEEDEISFGMKVNGCCMKAVKDYFDKENLEPLGCPIANIFMYSLELNTGLSPELLPVDKEGEFCKLTMAKIATSDVVKR